ncbi:hypothetical protein ACNQ21_03320 [Mycoplasma sp. VS299A]|uniref:hypothetical protein n=1 Tax=Mycoplasma sp. VS299A TaxID=3401690 RepID=UPI003AAEBBB2
MSILKLDDLIRLGEDHYIEFCHKKFAIDTSFKSVARLEKFLKENKNLTTAEDFMGKGEEFLKIFFKYPEQFKDFLMLVNHSLLSPKQQDIAVLQVFQFWQENTFPEQIEEGNSEKK